MNDEYSVVVVAFHDYPDKPRISIGQTTLHFKTINELIAWADDSGVDFTK